MLLFALLIISLLMFSLVRFSSLQLVFILSNKAHQLCLDGLPKNSTALVELKALVCAENFSNLNDSKYYLSSGLIHLFVVSGAHLIVIENLLTLGSYFFKLSSRFTLSLLLIYAFACGLNAPVVRCLIAFALNVYLKNKNIHWPLHLKLLIVGTLTLCFNFPWISSLSLQMSWIAAFMAALALNHFKSNSVLIKQSLFYFSLLPTVIFFQIPSFIVILLNLFLAPVLEFLLFPLALGVWFFNFLHPIFDFLILFLKFTLRKFELDFQIQLENSPEYLIHFNWLFIFILHGVFHVFYIKKMQQKDQAYEN